MYSDHETCIKWQEWSQEQVSLYVHSMGRTFFSPANPFWSAGFNSCSEEKVVSTVSCTSERINFVL